LRKVFALVVSPSLPSLRTLEYIFLRGIKRRGVLLLPNIKHTQRGGSWGPPSARDQRLISDRRTFKKENPVENTSFLGLPL
jgi:hypothetical protein